MDAEEEGMLEAEDGEVEDDSFEGVNVSEEGCVCKPGTALANHSPQRTNMMCVNQEGVDRKSSSKFYRIGFRLLLLGQLQLGTYCLNLGHELF